MDRKHNYGHRYITGLSRLITSWEVTPSLLSRKLQKSRHGPSASLECHIDNSPIILLSDDHSSDGSTISGSLSLSVTEDGIQMESLYAELRVHVMHKKPFKKGCKGCKHQTTELKRRQILTATTFLNRGKYTYPLSYQIPNYVPPSMDTPLVSVVYKLKAIASIRRKGIERQSPEIITISRTLPVARSITVSSVRGLSHRIYPTNGIEVCCSLNSVMCPRGTNKATLTIRGLRSCPGNGEDVQFWRVCKGTWILEETVKTTAIGCTEHAREDLNELSTALKNRRALGETSFYDGWTTDDAAGTLNMQFPFSTRKQSTQYCQDTGDHGDTSITHALVLELQLMKEIYPRGRADLSVRTGVGKVLRSEHRVVFSDYTKLSDFVDGDEERLPCYHDSWPRPPIYRKKLSGQNDS
ncbi:hypothetical protein ACHAPU_006931 [Fusarium lateritium]